MARAQSLNVWIEIDGKKIYPLEVGEFSEGEEGRIKVADGERKYGVRDQIFDIGEVELTILLTKDRYEYEICQDWCQSGAIKDIYVVYYNSAKTPVLTYLFTNTSLAMGKKNAFNRDSKEVDKKKYVLLPEFIQEVI